MNVPSFAAGEQSNKVSPAPQELSSGWDAVISALHSVRSKDQMLLLTITADNTTPIWVDFYTHRYYCETALDALPESLSGLKLYAKPIDPDEPLFPWVRWRTFDPLLWVLGNKAFANKRAPWLILGEKYSLIRWPNLTEIPYDADDLRAVSMLANGLLTIDELALVSQVTVEQSQRLVSTLSFMGVLRGTGAPRIPAKVVEAMRESAEGAATLAEIEKVYGGSYLAHELEETHQTQEAFAEVTSEESHESYEPEESYDEFVEDYSEENEEPHYVEEHQEEYYSDESTQGSLEAEEDYYEEETQENDDFSDELDAPAVTYAEPSFEAYLNEQAAATQEDHVPAADAAHMRRQLTRPAISSIQLPDLPDLYSEANGLSSEESAGADSSEEKEMHEEDSSSYRNETAARFKSAPSFEQILAQQTALNAASEDNEEKPKGEEEPAGLFGMLKKRLGLK